MQTIVSEHTDPNGWVLKFVNDDNRTTLRYIIPSGDIFAVVNPFNITADYSIIEYDLESAIASARKTVVF